MFVVKLYGICLSIARRRHPYIDSLIYIFIYICYVRIPYMHSALFVRDAIFYTCRSELRLKARKKLYVRLTYGIPRKERKGIKGVETNATGIVALLKVLNKGRHG